MPLHTSTSNIDLNLNLNPNGFVICIIFDVFVSSQYASFIISDFVYTRKDYHASN